jgi:hypothetical protein
MAIDVVGSGCYLLKTIIPALSCRHGGKRRKSSSIQSSNLPSPEHKGGVLLPGIFNLTNISLLCLRNGKTHKEFLDNDLILKEKT